MDWKITLTEMPLNSEGKLRVETMTLHNVDMLGARRIGKMNCEQRGFTAFDMAEVESFVTLKAGIRKNLIRASEEEDKHTRI